MKEDKEWILEVLSQPKYKSLSPEEAQAIYKMNKPKQSESRKLDFWGGGYKPKPKGLADMSDEEALKLTPKQFLERARLRWEMR
jgi:hypothetical protein